LNDTNLQSAGIRASGEVGSRSCPRCQGVKLQIIGIQRHAEVDRCEHCHGIFFDNGELEHLVEALASKPGWVDKDRLNAIVREETPTEDFKNFTYLKCPECSEMMQRKAYGAKSGVVTDRCRKHGTWLDGGELHRILKWASAGGRDHDTKVKKQQAEDLERSAAAFREKLLALSNKTSGGWGI